MRADVATDEITSETSRRGRWIAPALVASAGLVLVMAGGLLWWRHGGAVFNDYVLAALAWCF